MTAIGFLVRHRFDNVWFAFVVLTMAAAADDNLLGPVNDGDEVLTLLMAVLATAMMTMFLTVSKIDDTNRIHVSNSQWWD